MSGFAVFRWNASDTQTECQVTAVRSGFLSSWRERVRGSGWLILSEPEAPALTALSDDGRPRCVIGQIFDRRATDLGTAAPGRPVLGHTPFAAFAGDLAKHHWGAFVAVELDPEDPLALHAFRDPIGALDCVAWSTGSMIVLTSRPELLLPSLPPRYFAINWAGVSGLISLPGAASEHLPFKGLIDVPAGAITRLAGHDIQILPIWSPADHARQGRPRTPDDALALPSLVDACMSAWAQNTACAVAELSGGLDSAIVAASLARLPICPVQAWLHYHPPDPEGDERFYARSVADHLHLPLTEIGLSPPCLEKPLLESLPVRLRPILSGVSLSHDRDLAARAAALGADTLFTGHGGDALFFQAPTPLIAGDLLRGGGRPARRLRAVEDLARWTGRPIWTILAAALTAPLGILRPHPPVPFVDLTSSRLEQDVGQLAWLSDIRGVSPAKALQISGLALSRAVFSAAVGANGVKAVHPLISQPLIERCLAISAFDLTEGRRDRALIRGAYRGRLPAILLDRSGKGDMAAFYGRTLAASVPFLRSYLLNGVLAAHSVIDVDRLDTLLDPDVIMVRELSVEFFTLVFMERWARHWLGVGVFSTP